MYIANRRAAPCECWWYIKITIICGMWLVIASGAAVAQSGGGSHDEFHGIKDNDWKEMGHSERVEVMKMIIAQTKGNYERIRTWEGTYKVRMEQYLSQAYAAELLKENRKGRQAAPVMQTFDYPLQFAVDMKTDSIYRSTENTEMAFFEIGSKKAIKIPSLGAVNERSVVTPEHYLHFPPKMVWPGFSMLPDHPEAQDKRAAFREPREKALKQSQGDLLNPCEWFGFSQQAKFWEDLTLYVRAMDGEAGEEVKRKTMENVNMYQNVTASGTQYKLIAEMTSPRPIFFASIWSSASGFNPLSLTVSEDKQGKQLLSTMEYRWKQFNGIYLPAWRKEVVFNKDSKKTTYVVECTLESCSVNHPLDSHQFDYRGLGLKEGDLVVDRIEKVMCVMKDGQPLKLANFGEKYVSPDKRVFALSQGWKLTILVSLVFLLTTLLIARRYRREKPLA